MANYRAIMRLLVQGHSYSDIVRTENCSRRAIASAKKTLNDHHLTTPDQVDRLGEEQLDLWFPDGRSQKSEAFDQPDFSTGAEINEVRSELHLATGLANLRGQSVSAEEIRVFEILRVIRCTRENPRLGGNDPPRARTGHAGGLGRANPHRD
ncbi:hypothetical protein GCM10007173_35340 [Glutamicibacter ardleyensis]|uniref:Transposase n=1 Tax=Glutamicibacter ardleyensis TaxID=225894 RepID=A0ABQ2DW13_9MICC|nr:hypothetical protein GCM10007173_35340 [Glutamicibacter ardleyensis]